MDAATFHFTNAITTFTYNISECVIIHIDTISHSLASLYFTNDFNENIYIPSGFVVYEYDFRTKEKVPLKSIQDHFVLCWTDNYTIEHNNKIILDIKNERKWMITASPVSVPDSASKRTIVKQWCETELKKRGAIISEEL